ncbi:hypothetical protein [Aquimarina muelleri]|uniref:hypothetical protein n=1 Tax=Aquimarina muelleri TaxID=279356 RepID=UPI00040812CF|nr:hypothetical protein [Aquimarina muelleri]MCX2764811.1 hypothetical protein [Aquimarina muelleri]
MKKLIFKKIFLIDGIGAVLSAFLLGVILVRFEHHFGMPIPTLYFLSIFPCLFALYDLICYLLSSEKGTVLIKIIAFLNIAYCFISISSVFKHHQSLTSLGLIYFILELAIIILLITMELKIAFNTKLDTQL